MFRQDIQALRGIAVSAVVLYHANLPFVKGGYLGVDVFFVISGYLITSMLIKDIASQRFTFTEFYRRRVYRLFPAAFAVLAVCSIGAFWLMTPSEKSDFGFHLLGAVTFTSNITHWLNTGYFDDSAELLPLLHTWSLSIEEQYYLFVPLLLSVLVDSKARIFVIVGGTLLSLALFTVFAPSFSDATFYLIPFRVWELGIGSSLALLVTHKGLLSNRWLAWLGLIVLAVVLVFPFKNSEYAQVLSMLAITTATALLIYAGREQWETWKLSRGLAWLGEISYSLYLVHWPIFAFLNIAYVGGVGLPRLITLLALIASFVLAWLLHRFVEQPFRIKPNGHFSEARQRPFAPMILVVFVLSLVGLWLVNGKGPNHRYLEVTEPVFGLARDCSAQQALADTNCSTSEEPEMLLLGDSHAMHLVPGLLTNSNAKLIQFTGSTCPPSLQLGFYAPPKFTTVHSKACLLNNKTAIEYAVQTASVEVVVLASPWTYHLGMEHVFSTQDNPDGGLVRYSAELFKSDMHNLVQLLRQNGKRVIIVTAPPAQINDAGKCNVRKELGLLRLGQNVDCEISLIDAQRQRSESDQVMLELEESLSVPTFWFYDRLCPQGICKTKFDNTILYRDFGHLNHEGSRYIGEEFDLYELLMQSAQ